MPGKSLVEELICSRDFPYLHPYFYNNPYALRCELGVGDSDEEYMKNAGRRAREIYHILFPDGADAIIFNHWIYDYCDSGDAEDPGDDGEAIEVCVKRAAADLRFLREYQARYRHVTVRNLQTYDDDDCVWRNRVVCYSDGRGFDFERLIDQEIREVDGHEVSFVSFAQECIYSIYDDRGCDVVFLKRDKMREFYDRLRPYFLEFDLAEMKARYGG